jgi:hypothetical protein
MDYLAGFVQGQKLLTGVSKMGLFSEIQMTKTAC